MPIYQKSNGQSLNTSEMPQPYLERALAKAQAENNTDNIEALQEEFNARSESTIDTSPQDEEITAPEE